MEKIGMPEEEIYALDDEESVCMDLGDMEDPICIDCDGWMSLQDAESIHELLGMAIAAVKDRAANGKKPPQGTTPGG